MNFNLSNSVTNTHIFWLPIQICKFTLPSSIKLYPLKNEVLSLQILRQSVSKGFPIEWIDICVNVLCVFGRVSVIKVSTGELVKSFDLPKTSVLEFSPLNKVLATWQHYTSKHFKM